MDKKEFYYDDIVMSSEDIVNVVESAISQLDIETVIEIVESIIDESEEAEPGILKNEVPIVKMSYICREMYKKGLMVAIYLMNESIKQSFDDAFYSKKAGAKHE